MGHLLPGHEVDKEALQATEAPGRLEQLAAEMGRVAAGRQPSLVEVANLPGDRLDDPGPADLREREALQVGERLRALQGIAVAGRLRAVAPARVAGDLGRVADPGIAVARHRAAAQLLLLG